MYINKLTSAEILHALHEGEISSEEFQEFASSKQAALTQGLAGNNETIIGDKLIIKKQPEQVSEITNEQDSPIQPPPRIKRYDGYHDGYYEIMEFDEEGKRVRSTLYNPEGEVHGIRVFDKTGIGCTQQYFSGGIPGAIHKYDEYGRMLEQRFPREDSEEIFTYAYDGECDCKCVNNIESPGLPELPYGWGAQYNAEYISIDWKIIKNNGHIERRIIEKRSQIGNEIELTFYNDDESNSPRVTYKIDSRYKRESEDLIKVLAKNIKEW